MKSMKLLEKAREAKEASSYLYSKGLNTVAAKFDSRKIDQLRK